MSNEYHNDRGEAVKSGDNFKKITIVAPHERVPQIEEILKQVDLIGLVMTKARGYGGRPNFYASDWSVETIVIDAYIAEQYLQQLRQRLKAACGSDEDGAGFLVVSDVSEIQALNQL